MAKTRLSSHPNRLRGLESLESRNLLATIVVTSLLDTGPGSLRQSLDIANTNGEADIILFDPSIAGGTIPLVQGELTITDDLAIVGTGETILGNDSARILEINNADGGPDISVEISDLRLTGGVSPLGGAIFNAENLTMNFVTVANGNSDRGGGIYNEGVAKINDSLIGNNQAMFQGGGIYNESDAVLVLQRSELSANQALLGGGVGNSGGIVEIHDSKFTQNSATGGIGRGGGVHSRGTNAIVLAIDSRFELNTATFGGAVNVESGQAEFIQVAVESNEASVGGGIANSGNFLLVDSAVVDNTARGDGTETGLGGGLASLGGSLIVRQNTVSSNRAAKGGGIYADGVSQPLTQVEYSTIAFNIGLGGGVHLEELAELSLYNSIVATNRTVAGGDSDLLDSSPLGAIAASFSLIGINVGTQLDEAPVPDINGNLIGGDTGVINPLLGGLALNGGQTLNHLPLPGSPAFNQGDPQPINLPLNDQRGSSRVEFSRVDMGSVESGKDCDCDDNGEYEHDDINLLQANIVNGTHLAACDLNEDGLTNMLDRDIWLEQAGIELLGAAFAQADANLDGAVDASDFNIWNANKFSSTSEFCSGDFNSDGVVDTSDFNIWNGLKFMPRPAANPLVGLPEWNRDPITENLSQRRNRSDSSPERIAKSAIDRVFSEIDATMG